MEKSHFILFILSFFCFNAKAQITFQVADSLSGKQRLDFKLANVAVHNGKEYIGKTNYLGQFTSPKLKKGDTLTFFEPNYFAYQYIVTKRKVKETQFIFMTIDPSKLVVNDSNCLASFPGGKNAMYRWMNENLVYPREAQELGIEGRCYVSMKILIDGTISDVKVVRGVPICPECDAEALRLFRIMPKWNPQKKDGEAIESTYQIPLTFKLN